MKIICISGKAGHGKDKLASVMRRALEADGYSVLITHYADLLKFVCRQYFDWDGEKDEYGRCLLQYVGTDKIREVNPDFWVAFVASILRIFKDEWDYVLIPDCRFSNEFEFLREMGFDATLVRVVRNGYTSPLTAEQQAHPSETALDKYPAEVIYNDGTESGLSRAAAEWLLRTNGIHQMCIEEL